MFSFHQSSLPGEVRDGLVRSRVAAERYRQLTAAREARRERREARRRARLAERYVPVA